MHESNPFDSAELLKTLTTKPGVYRMVDGAGEVLYVGKAGNLRKRVASYFRPAAQLGPKTQRLMAQVRRVEVTVTRTEGEALLLEDNLIKSCAPRYNILLRDDKTYPYIYLSSDQDFPRLSLYRGARSGKGRYFGPYPNAGAVRETIHLLQKLFLIRQCEDSFFRNRSRPCLQYQIRRCTAPCVGLIAPEAYAEDVRHAEMFLEGRSGAVIDELVRRMERAAAAREFEQAARYRDQIAHLRRIRERQYITTQGGDLDVIGAAYQAGGACIRVVFVRDGRQLGSKSYFPARTADEDETRVLRAFLTQYYLAEGQVARIPGRILISHALDEIQALAEVLSERAGHRVEIGAGARGERARLLEMAVENAAVSLAQRLASADHTGARLSELGQALGLDEPPARIECFDISHTRGELPVASCVVFGPEGALRSDYRRYNIRDIQPGDDYAAMRQALERRYTRLRREEGRLPDVLLIDGGKGQLRQASEVLDELQVEGVQVVGVAKGTGRKPGLERLFLPGRGHPLILSPTSAALHLVQQVRDEAHRFAITGHRQRRARERNTSVLEQIPGIGPTRRQRLLRQFGGLRGVARAGIEDLAGIDGISRRLAQAIYEAFHSVP